MTLLAQSPPLKVRPSAGFHAYQFDLQVRRELQQLLARKLLAHHIQSGLQCTTTTTLKTIVGRTGQGISFTG
jgi:hypothetical protein